MEPISVFEFTNNESNNDESFIEEIPYEEITSMEPFELKTESDKISDIVKAARNTILSEEIIQRTTDLPEAVSPSNPDNLGNGANNSPSKTPNSGTTSNVNPGTENIPLNSIREPDADPVSWIDSVTAVYSSEPILDEISEGCAGYCFPDIDGDGIDDRWDQCLGYPENYNGYADWDGCPEQIPKGTQNWHRDMK